MDITQYLVDEDGIRALSAHQTAKFFEKNTPVTQKGCHEIAARLAGEPVKPTPVQGETSYTVIAGTDNPKALQFCDAQAALDMNVMTLARETYGDFVPGCEKRGTVGHLFVYEMDVVRGVAFSIAQRKMCSINSLQLLERAVQDLARFFASSWTRATNVTSREVTAATPTALFQQFEALANALPQRFDFELVKVRKQLPLLFAPDYPQVLHHPDLWDMNIHVDLSTGAITGMVDWRDATIGPFGLSLWGLETLLGALGRDGWHFHAGHHGLRRKFWDTLYTTAGIATDSQRQAVRVGRIVGVFQAYGLRKGVPVEVGDLSLSILEQVLSVVEG